MMRGRPLLAPRRAAHRLVQRAVPFIALVAGASCGRDGSGVVSAASIALTASGSPTLGIGQNVTLYVHASDVNGTRIPAFAGVTWSSSVPTVASVTKSDTTAVVAGLAVGETVISATARQGVTAQITVRVGSVPVIGVSPTAAVFTGYRGLAVVPQTIAVTNAGAGTLTQLSATSSASWLQATFVDGVTTANPTANLRLQPTVGTLANGSHSATVTVSSGTAGVTPRTIPVTLQVSAGPVAFKIVAVSAPTQNGSAGQPVSQPPSVIVRAVDDTPVPGVAVTFAVSGGGTIAPTGAITTNAEGIAALASWTLGSQAGASQTVTATSPGLAGSPLTFTATTLSASKIVKVSGDNQSTVIGRALPQPIVVRVTDPNDAPVPNAAVTFAAGNGGSIAPVTATTDASGQASATWTLGTGLGAQTASATLVGPPGSPTVTFTATATGATAIAKVSGDGQQGPAGSVLPSPLRVRVTGANDLPVMGVTVTFSGDGNATPATASTDANGDATAQWALPPSIGPKSMVASVSTGTGVATTAFTATATTPPPSGILIVDGDNQTGRAGLPLAKQVVARVVNTIGGGIAGATVTFTPAAGSGQSFSPASGTTDSNGEIRTTWTLGNALGNYTATVASPGLSSQTITATANQLPNNMGVVTGAAIRVPSGVAPPPADQAVVSYAGAANGQVTLTDGSFTTPVVPAGTYTLTVSSGAGNFAPTSVYGVSVTGGQTTSVGTIPLANNGTGSISLGVHACTNVGDTNGNAVVRLFSGVNADQGGTLTRQWTMPFGVTHSESNVPYGIYTMTITAVSNDPSKVCRVHRQQVEHSFPNSGSLTSVGLILMSNP